MTAAIGAPAIEPTDDATDDGALRAKGKGVRVLIVDDEREVRTAMRRILGRAGYEVVCAENVGPGLAAARATPPDIAIVDLDMPTPGIELVRALKTELAAAVFVAVLSGRSSDPDQEACIAAGADDYLCKPLPAPALLRRVLAAARTQRAYIESRRACERAERLRVYGAEAAALLAHDLNNGLAIALANVSYSAEAVDAVDPEVRDALDATVRTLTRMTALVANFVDIGRIEDDALRPARRRVAIAALMQDVAAIHAPKTAHVACEVRCAPDLVAQLDPALIERVLHNLLGNAVRYCSGDGVWLEARPWRSADDEPGVEIVVGNAGPAIPQAVADALFTKYARGTDGKRGMGLYFCRLACEAHGGTIAHQATEIGPTFHIRLPNRSG